MRNFAGYSIIVVNIMLWCRARMRAQERKITVYKGGFFMAGGNSSWEKIQQGVNDTERLIVQREYNASMMKARQTLEFMVKNLADQAGILDESDLKNMIDALYENRWISKTTCENYHKIRMIGNKAAHEGDANAYSANQAYHMLSQEMYTFADEYRKTRKGAKPLTRPVVTQKSSSQSYTGTARKGTAGTGRANTGNSSGTARNSKGNAAAAGRTYAGTRNSSAASSRSRRRSGGRNASFSFYNLLKLLVPVLCIVLLLLVVKFVKPQSQTKETEGPTAVETMETTEAAPKETESTGPVYRTTDVLNVRPEPSTSSERIGQLNAGVTVEYVRAHDADWAVILYNGQEAYVASRYLQEE